MENKALLKLSEYRLTHADLEELTTEQAAVIGLLAFAASEVNVISRMYVLSTQEPSEQTPVNVAVGIQKSVALRLWSAKLFELFSFLEKAKKSVKETDNELQELLDEALAEVERLKQSEGYSVARDFRNEVSNHYSFNAAKKNVEYISDKANLNMYLSELTGNCYYPMGEELMFSGRVNRRGANLQTREEKMQMLDEWHSWNLEMNAWLNQLHARVADKLIFSKKSHRIAQQRVYWLPPQQIAEVSSGNAPVFFRRPTGNAL